MEQEQAILNLSRSLQWFNRLRREKEVLYYVVNGMSNREIANVLFVAEQTVKNIVNRRYLQVGDND